MATPGQGRIEHRLAVILAADVAGYSRLMGADEAGTARVSRNIAPDRRLRQAR
jgi:class 3 adenylate cyclase